MKITIISKNIELSKEEHDVATQRCERLCSRFMDHIMSVTLRITDINGPKGGVDKECLTRIHLRNGHTVTATKRHRKPGGAIGSSLQTIRSILRRHLGQRKAQLVPIMLERVGQL